MKERSLNQRLLGAAVQPVRALAEARNRPLRPLAALAGILLAGGVVSHLLEQQIAGELTGQLLDSQRLAVERDVRRFDASLKEAEHSARRLADLISYRSDGLAARDDDLEASLERSADGTLRSRRDRFQSGRDAGILLPAGKAPTPESRRFLGHAREITRLYGQGGRRGPVANSWVMPLSSGLVLHWPEFPEYLFQPGAPADTRLSGRMQYSSPAQSPEGHPRWTPPAYDPAARKWLISVVAPFYRDGRWAGSAGHDLMLSSLLDDLEDPASGSASPFARALYVTDGEGRLLAGRNGLRSHDQRLPERYRPFLERAREPQGPRMFASGPDHVIVAPIPTLSAYALYRVDGSALRGSLRGPLTGMAIARNLFLAGLTAGGIALLWQERRRRLHLQTLTEGGQRETRELLDAVGHELRAPLSIVTGSLHRLLHHNQPLDPAQRKALELASAETRRLRGLVDDLTDLGRGSLGWLNLRTGPVDAAKVASRCCEQARASLDRPVELHLPEPPAGERLTIRGDAERLQQAISQLIETADHASPAHSPVHVGLESDGGWLHIAVRDVGHGAGLGLAVARMLAEAMGGRMSRDETPGAGGTVQLSFPLTASVAVVSPAVPATA